MTTWRKAYGANGGCVEVAPVWRKSSRSQFDEFAGDCVEAARLTRGVGIRDSKNPYGPVLVVGRDQWSAFITRVKGGQK